MKLNGRIKIKMSPMETFNSVVLLFIAILFFLEVMWMGGTLVGSGGLSYNAYYTKYKPLIVVSGSMSPTIEVNSLIMVEKTPFDELEVDDIIVFKTSTYGLVSHRIVEKVAGGYLTKGDNNNNVDKWVVNEESYKGRVHAIHNSLAPFITFLFGDLNEVNLARVFFGFVMLILLISGVFGLVAFVYYYFVLFYFIYRESKRTEKGGQKVVDTYYSFVSLDKERRKLIELFDELGKTKKFKNKWILRYRILRLHRLIKQEERMRRKLYKIYQKCRSGL